MVKISGIALALVTALLPFYALAESGSGSSAASLSDNESKAKADMNDKKSTMFFKNMNCNDARNTSFYKQTVIEVAALKLAENSAFNFTEQGDNTYKSCMAEIDLGNRDNCFKLQKNLTDSYKEAYGVALASEADMGGKRNVFLPDNSAMLQCTDTRGFY